MAKIDLSKGLYDEIEQALNDLKKEDENQGGIDEKRVPEGNQAANAALFLDLNDIEPDPDQPRKSFDAGEDENSLDGLRESILRHGVLQPILVRRMAGKYRIISGERRWRASCAAHASGEPCRRAGYDLSRIPVVIRDPVNDVDRLEMQLVENLARTDMPVIDTARALARLRSCMDPKPSMEELAKRLGRSKAWVHQMLSMVSPESEAVAEALGVSVESIGRTDLSRMCGWNKDEEKRAVISAIRARLDAGEPLTRALVDEEEDRYEQAKLRAGDPTVSEGSQNIGREQFPAGDQHEPLQENPTSRTGEQDMERNLEEGTDYIVVRSPKDLEGIDLDDGSYDEDEEAGVGEEDGEVEDEGALLSIPVSIPMDLLRKVFAMAGETMSDQPTPGEIVDALSALVDGSEGNHHG
jgi:ParB family chromosome partitioning protein